MWNVNVVYTIYEIGWYLEMRGSHVMVYADVLAFWSICEYVGIIQNKNITSLKFFSINSTSIINVQTDRLTHTNTRTHARIYNI